MARISLALFLAGGLLLSDTANAQCRGGGAATQGTTAATGTTGIATTGGTTGAALFTGPGSFAYDVMIAQMLARQVAQQRYMLAMQQQQAKQEKLAARRYRAEQTRTAVAESRARNRAALAAKNGLTSAKAQPRALAYQAVGR
jgi:hypothetical protein